jgi:hypothetical protein
MADITLEEFLTLRGVDVANSLLHVIREPNASRDWKLVSGSANRDEALFAVALADTAHNAEVLKNGGVLWPTSKAIVVLIDTGVAASGMDHIEGAYLLLGVLEVLGRKSGYSASESGSFPDSPAWELVWTRRFSQYLFVHPGLSRGWRFHAAGNAGTAARNFVLVGSANVTVARPVPRQIRGFQLTLGELQERIGMSNWRDFLAKPGVYLIQVYDPGARAFYHYVGKASKRLTDRWRTYAETGGTAGERDEENGVLSGNKYLAQLCEALGEQVFRAGWRIQVIRVADSDEINGVEQEVKESLCTYHLDSTAPARYRSAFGLNGN